MRWRQVAAALSIAVAAGYLLTSLGFSPLEGASGAVILYILIRWLIAWIFRIRYWYYRGTRGIYTRTCPNCDQYIYRKSGDWIISCHRCGWTAGPPVVRWLTKSVPSIQLRRTIDGPRIVVIVVAVAVVVFGASASSEMGMPEGVTESSPNSSQFDDAADSSLNETKIEVLIHRYTNERRAERGLSELNFDKELRDIARYHSRDMGVNDYYSHTSPDGEGFSDRYERFGYNCGVPAGDRYLTGAENIAYRYREEFTFNGNESLVANSFVEGWMNSEGHRENILTENWQNHGAGVYVVEDGDTKTIYATQNFC